MKSGWTQSALAEASGVNRGVLCQIANNLGTATPKFIGPLCSVLEPDQAGELLAAYLSDEGARVATACEQANKLPRFVQVKIMRLKQ